MIPAPERNELEAFVRLEHDADFQVVLDYLKRSLAQIREKNDKHKDDTLLRWGQGTAQTLNDFITLAETARETLRNIKV